MAQRLVRFLAAACGLVSLVGVGVITPVSAHAVAAAPSHPNSQATPELEVGRQLTADYRAGGASFQGDGFAFNVGQTSVGRAPSMHQASVAMKSTSWGAVYSGAGFGEDFRAGSPGIEQTFTLENRPAGGGPLLISVPVSGLRASSHGRVVELQDSVGRIRATYSDLRVVDAHGKTVAATMAASGSSLITISVQDRTAEYPLSVDPTWSEVTELSDSSGAMEGGPGQVAIAGTIAVVGDPTVTVGSNSQEGAAYVFQLNNGTWTETAKLTASDGTQDDNFGQAVAIEGDTIFVGAPQHPYTTAAGAVYVFGLSGGSWTQNAELTASPTYGLGSSLAVSGSTLAVGDPNYNAGSVHIFTGSGSSWTQSAVLIPSDGVNGQTFLGASVAVDGNTVLSGAYTSSVSEVGASYIFTMSGGSWSQTAEFSPSDGSSGDGYGQSVALSSSTAVVGAMHTTINSQMYAGSAYVYSLSGGTWSLTQELTNPNGPPIGGFGGDFGSAVAILNSTLMVGSLASEADGTQMGVIYGYAPSQGTWSETTSIPDPTQSLNDEFGTAISLSNPFALFGADGAGGVGAPGGAFLYSSNLVQPQGSPVSADALGGGSNSEPCQCSDTAPAQTSVGDPVDSATGDLHETSTDLDLPGAGLPLAFTRTYDAQAAQAQAATDLPVPPLGYGWSFNLGMNLSYNASTQTAAVTEENGARVTFTPYVSGTSPAWCTSAVNFCAGAPRIEATLNQNSDGTWTYVRTTGGQTTFTFSSSGALTAITNAQGDSLQESSYAAGSGQTPCPIGDTCTAWTSSSSGRQLVLAINSSGQLVSLFDANSSLAASFAYTGTGCTTWGSGQSADLCTATDPGNLTTTYAYDSTNATPSFDFDMLSDNPPGASSPAVNTYDNQGRVTQQTGPSGAVITLAYSGTNSSLQGGTTTVTRYPLGTGTGEPHDTTVFQYSSNVLVGETFGSGGSSPSTQLFDRDPVSLQASSVIDGDGNVSTSTYQTYNVSGGTSTSSANVLTSSDAVGNTTQYAYNSFNQAWCTVDAADYADGARCPSTAPTSPPAPGAADSYPGVSLSFYNSSDQLTASTDGLGNTSTHSYTSGASGVPNGLAYCTVDPVDYQKSVTCPAYGAAHVTGTTTATYDAAGDKTSSTDADGNTISYAFNAAGHPGLVSATTDPDGTVTSYTYNGAGQVTSQVATFGSYGATTLYAYDNLGRKYCEVDPYEAAQSVTCPSSPPSSPPTPTSDPYLGAAITTYDSDGRVVQSTNPIGGITLSAYDQAGELFCSVAPFEAATGVMCPSSAPSSPPTVGSDPYLGATITTYDANGRVVQVTNPLGGITLTSYDPAGNVSQTTGESNNSTSAPNIVTTNSYDADSRVTSTTVGSGSSRSVVSNGVPDFRVSS
jgi:YD repeat-containing protein